MTETPPSPAGGETPAAEPSSSAEASVGTAPEAADLNADLFAWASAVQPQGTGPDPGQLDPALGPASLFMDGLPGDPEMGGESGVGLSSDDGAISDDLADPDGGLRETKIAKKVRYRKYVSEVTMAYNRLTMRQLNLFQVLGVPVTATANQIKRAYEKLHKLYDFAGILGDHDKELQKKAEAVLKKLHDAYVTLGDARSRRDYMMGMKTQRQELEKRKRDSLMHFHEAMALYKDNDLSKSTEALRKAMALDSNNPVFYRLLKTLEDAQRNTESEKYFQAGLISFTKRKDIPRAAQLLRKAVALNPNFRNYVKLGEVLSADRSLRGEAVESYQKALAMDPGNPGLLTETGKLCLQLNRKQDAVDMFHEALRWDERSTEAMKFRTQLVAEGFRPSAEADKKKRSGRK
jgi:tetratricopeptide (TPR) repeat protein